MGKKKKIKLHIGCGGVYKPGYINIDAFDASVADVIARGENLPFSNEEVDLIEAYHLLEHLTILECKTLLKEWFRVLKKGGKVKIEVPDLEKNMEIFLRSSHRKRWGPYRGEFSYGRIEVIYGKGDSPGQLHKTGFDRRWLKELFQEAGFTEIRVYRKKGTPEKGENLCLECIKPLRKPSKHRKREKSQASKGRGKEKHLIPILRKGLKLRGKIAYLLRYLADFLDPTFE